MTTNNLPVTTNKNQIFIFEGINIRTEIMANGEPLFCGKDICDYCGDTDHKRSLSRIDDDEKSQMQVLDRLGRPQTATGLIESGVYNLLFSFHPENATKDGGSEITPHTQERIAKIKRFKRWVTHDVIPSIRKTGSYSIAQLSPADQALTLARALVASAEREAIKDQLLIEAKEKIDEIRPDAIVGETVKQATNTFSIADAAALIIGKDFNDAKCSEPILFNFIRDELKHIQKVDNGNKVYIKYLRNGWYVECLVPYWNGSRFEQHLQPRLTGTGLSHIINEWKRLKCGRNFFSI
jgi:prophage antirepressor-like protein